MHSSAAEVTRALLDLKSEGGRFTMSLDSKGRIVASWPLPGASSTVKSEQYRVTLRGETGEYTSWQYQLEEPNTTSISDPFPSYNYTFHGRDLTDPVDQVLAAHGWVIRRSAVRKFVERVVAAIASLLERRPGTSRPS